MYKKIIPDMIDNDNEQTLKQFIVEDYNCYDKDNIEQDFNNDKIIFLFAIKSYWENKHPGVKLPDIYYKDLETVKKYCSKEFLIAANVEKIVKYNMFTDIDNFNDKLKVIYDVFKKTASYLGDYKPKQLNPEYFKTYGDYIHAQLTVNNFDLFIYHNYEGRMFVYDSKKGCLSWYDKNNYKEQMKVLKHNLVKSKYYDSIVKNTHTLSTRPLYSFSILTTDFLEDPYYSPFEAILDYDAPKYTFFFQKEADRDNAVKYLNP
jgi:hypothetical protein